jgi:SAM-dependent methyltransferase
VTKINVANWLIARRQRTALIPGLGIMVQYAQKGVLEGRIGLDERLKRKYPANYDAHARSVPADAYWAQVRRTINGEPIGEVQIMLIVDAIMTGLSLTEGDVVLDLACGNGALSSCLFEKCAGLVGIDISPYLIEVAQSVFARLPNYDFSVDDIASYVKEEGDTSRFTKALFYAGLQYFPREGAITILKSLNERFLKLERVFIGNVPNRREASRFFLDNLPAEEELDDPEARIGVWYFPEEVQALASACGWSASISYMPAEFYASQYRFDVTLERLRS